MAKNFKYWPDGWPESLNYPNVPVFKLLDQTAKRSPNRLAMIFGGMELTFSELKNLTERFANALKSLGVGKGDKVAIHLPNCPQFAIAYYGALRTGAAFTPVSPLLSPSEIEHQLNDSQSKVLVSLDLLYPGAAEAVAKTTVSKVITTSIADCFSAVIQPLKPLGKFPVEGTLDMAQLLAEHQPDPLAVEIDVEKDLAHLAYTGGTTGVSKGVMLTHKNVICNVLQYSCWFAGAQLILREDGTFGPDYPPDVDPHVDRMAVTDEETALVVVPWFHAMGTIAYLNNPVYAGSTMVVFPRFDPVEYITAIGKYGATTLGGAPQLFVPLVNLPNFKDYDLSGIKMAGSGAAPLPVPVLKQLEESFTGIVLEAYGLTEVSMGATCNPPIKGQTRAGSVGLPIFDTEIIITDPASGDELPIGEEGEICIKGPQVMQGYWGRPEATAEVLKDGWLRTGDIGRMDDDGFLFITDRIKDLILYKGYNVYPRQLEEVLYDHPAVENAAVVGKKDPDAGEKPIAFVQLRSGMDATEEDIMEFVNSRVAAYKKLRGVIFVSEIPVSGAGKILKRELRKQLE
ncbi:long-chain-fatty-acid--CoA ligase [Desulfatibacillum aliphaticivorans]|uniref:long-chain-fatty-acid--CoA ligase n=1 Tax=Desulfatibacillum aliphaticivorans TaxID=218208 RepID=UPI000418143D|nr:long-chain fatty acid--CoA ligase [Desulfatibacillum aliphaticivorans]